MRPTRLSKSVFRPHGTLYIACSFLFISPIWCLSNDGLFRQPQQNCILNTGPRQTFEYPFPLPTLFPLRLVHARLPVLLGPSEIPLIPLSPGCLSWPSGAWYMTGAPAFQVRRHGRKSGAEQGPFPLGHRCGMIRLTVFTQYRL
jgi:hypothetical protein